MINLSEAGLPIHKKGKTVRKPPMMESFFVKLSALVISITDVFL